MIINLIGSNVTAKDEVISLRCPACKQLGTFGYVDPGYKDYAISKEKQVFHFGQRKCPKVECQAHIFVIYSNRKIIASYPSEKIEFDSANIPEKVLKPLEEAITCHSIACFNASALMIRKSLEELCADKEATGGNLKEKINSLNSKVLLPKELLEAADHIRLLGNDAAHINSNVFNNIGKEEIEVAIELTKEIVKGIYQYSSLLQKLKKLKKGSSL